MKKLVMMLLMAVTASTAFAQDDVVKQILKLKDYKEALNLLNSNLNGMNAEQKAKCYNKVVDLALEKIQAEQEIMASNDLKKENVPFDTLGFYDASNAAIDAGLLCNQFDNMPNAKGKIKPKFEANKDRLYPQRINLINGGIYYQEKNDLKKGFEYLARYVDSADAPLFKSFDKAQDANLTQIAFYAAVFAYQLKDMANVDKYATIALNDPERGKDALNLKIAVAQENLKTKEDSLNYINTLEGLYATDKNNDIVFESLAIMYSQMGMNDKQDAIFAEKLAADPDNFTVWAMRGQSAMIDQKLDEAIGHFHKALKKQPENAQILTWIGACLLDRATQAEERALGKTGRLAPAAEAQILPLFEEAKTHLENARRVDPAREKSKWAYPLYRCYYRLYGANDERTKEAETYTK